MARGMIAQHVQKRNKIWWSVVFAPQGIDVILNLTPPVLLEHCSGRVAKNHEPHPSIPDNSRNARMPAGEPVAELQRNTAVVVSLGACGYWSCVDAQSALGSFPLRDHPFPVSCVEKTGLRFLAPFHTHQVTEQSRSMRFGIGSA